MQTNLIYLGTAIIVTKRERHILPSFICLRIAVYSNTLLVACVDSAGASILRTHLCVGRLNTRASLNAPRIINLETTVVFGSSSPETETTFRSRVRLYRVPHAP